MLFLFSNKGTVRPKKKLVINYFINNHVKKKSVKLDDELGSLI